ncbi:ROK family transcriptional regulator [Paludibacterium purpuratum]|uniref:Putative NBD/HSP70 family sugar kinase n=1 Tax=Paludibacterium purpuratum TaxID=1144873 RepID=A0A4R7B5X3_9NEIS|nr:ROK family transcriptional regulator [Paludibacterium purpuratum]TDR80080.1 putative NBD/HSP70 family sugar kinase [Paludibacterium purpuratum]
MKVKTNHAGRLTAPVTRGPVFVRQGNEWAIYQHLLALTPASSPQLAQSTGLSKVTTSAALNNLERLGLVTQSGVRVGSAGRSPRLYAPRAEAGFVVAFDMGAEWTRGALADLTGSVAVRQDRRTPTHTADLIALLADMVSAMLAEHGVAPTDVLTKVIGSPGVLDAKKGCLRLAGNLPGWESEDLLTQLQQVLGADLIIDNDINLATLGEQKCGVGREVENFVFMSIGTGVGLGIVAEGKLYRGAGGFAGEIAMLPPSPNSTAQPAAGTSHRGLYETCADARAIVAHAHHLGLAVPSAEAVFAAAAAGDARAIECVGEEARQIAWALKAIVPILDPALVVLGGGIGRNSALLLPAIRQHLTDFLPIAPPEFAVSATGTDAVLLGAIEHGLDHARLKAFEQLMA